MSNFTDQPNRDAALIRAEQNFFEQARAQHQHHNQQLTALQTQLSEEQHQHQEQLEALEDTIQILRCQLAQAQEEIDTANGRLTHLLETQVDPIVAIQLNQVQEELNHALLQLDALLKWRHVANRSVKLQLKLLCKNLLLRLSNYCRWFIPLKGARRIRSLLLPLKQCLSATRQ